MIKQFKFIAAGLSIFLASAAFANSSTATNTKMATSTEQLTGDGPRIHHNVAKKYMVMRETNPREALLFRKQLLGK